jgi:hypothetical protein
MICGERRSEGEGEPWKPSERFFFHVFEEDEVPV